jgi:hypothetical protein
LHLAFSEAQLDRAKEVIRGPPGYQEDGFRWPIEAGEVTFSSKDNFSLPFQNVFDGRTVDNLDEQEALPADQIGEHDVVEIAYMPVLFPGKNSTKTDTEEYRGGVTFQLQSIVICFDREVEVM